MPTVSIYEDDVTAELGEVLANYGSKQNLVKSFDELCFSFGLELDEVTSEYEMFKKERGDAFKPEDAVGKSTEKIFRVEVPANRYDLLCHEGLMIAFKVFLGLTTPPKIVLSRPDSVVQIDVDASVYPLRPFVVGAVLRNIKFTPSIYRSFIDAQDKLHQNLCRRRTLVAIGTHDLDKIDISGRINYSTRSPSDIHFTPLKQTTAMSGEALMEFYSKHPDLKEYCRIIKDSPVFPLITDKASSDRVLSLPPIINSEHSKISLDTRNVFIEMTATDLTKANVCLNTFISAFSQYVADQPFSVEPVMVNYPADHGYAAVAGQSILYPNLTTRTVEVDAELIKASINKNDATLTPESISSLLTKTCCTAVPTGSSNLAVSVPVYRSDIMHACDVVEDACIAYGFGNIVPEQSPTLGRPREQPINKLSDLIREKMAMFGYDECLNWTLCSERENFNAMGRDVPTTVVGGEEEWSLTKEVPVRLSNPKTKEFEIVRTSLLPGLLKVVASNKHNPVPIRLFEVGDVVFQSAPGEAVNERRVASIFVGKTAGFELKHGLMNALMRFLGYVLEEELKSAFCRIKNTYTLRPSSHPSFMKEMQCEVCIDDVPVGVIGVVHPNVLQEYGIDFGVASAMELNLELFLERIMRKE
jgi:phenylalanyl-tRNA synthetase beta chain